VSLVPETPEPDFPTETAVAGDQIGAHLTEAAGHHGPFHTHCENCGTKLAGPYCHHCGQHDFEFHRSFWHVFLEGLESFLHFDSKLFHTVATLIFRPGRLTAEFNAGKRTSQMPPLRLYIFVSLVFFFLFFLDQHSPGRQVEREIAATAEDDGKGEAEVKPAWSNVSKALAGEPNAKRKVDLLREAAEERRTAVENEPTPDHELTPTASSPSIQAEGSEDASPASPKSSFVQWLETQAHRASSPEHQTEMVEKFMHTLPRMLLFCLPVFALYTRFLYRKSGLVYLQHLVLALHFHTLILLWSMLKDGWVFLAGFVGTGAAGLVTGLFKVWLLLYPFLMLRHLFDGSWPKTILKTGLLGFIYAITVLIAAAISGFIIFALV
jgi:hypothetical protein